MKVCEAFRSLQGEGKKIGVPTFFIRSVGCNLQCAWCDTQYAMSEDGEEMSVDAIMEMVRDDTDVCLTGGEPMLQKDTVELLRKLSDAHKTVVLETNGSVSLKEVPASDFIISKMCQTARISSSAWTSNVLHPECMRGWISATSRC